MRRGAGTQSLFAAAPSWLARQASCKHAGKDGALAAEGDRLPRKGYAQHPVIGHGAVTELLPPCSAPGRRAREKARRRTRVQRDMRPDRGGLQLELSGVAESGDICKPLASRPMATARLKSGRNSPSKMQRQQVKFSGTLLCWASTGLRAPCSDLCNGRESESVSDVLVLRPRLTQVADGRLTSPVSHQHVRCGASPGGKPERSFLHGNAPDKAHITHRGRTPLVPAAAGARRQANVLAKLPTRLDTRPVKACNHERSLSELRDALVSSGVQARASVRVV
jgi:hypothetical protein